MAWWRALVFLALVAIVCEGSILEPVVTKERLADILLESDNVAVFYTHRNEPSCMECTTAERVIEDLAKEAAASSEGAYRDVRFVVVDCIESIEICKERELKHVPAFLLFSEGLMIYTYEEDYFHIVSLREFVQKRIGPKTVVVKSNEKLNEFINAHKMAIVGFFEDSEDPLYGSFKRTAAFFIGQHAFAEVVLPREQLEEVLEEQDLWSSSHMVVLYTNLGGERNVIPYEGVISRKRVSAWIESQTPWGVYNIEDKQFHSLVNPNLIIVTAYLDLEATSDNEATIQQLEKISNSYKDKIIFSYMLVDTSSDLTDFKKLGYSGEKFPILMLYNNGDRATFTLPEESDITGETVEEFISDFMQGRLRQRLVKQAVPEQDEDATVKIVVYDTFRQTVFDPENDVVVFFYLPEKVCPHCMEFLRDFERTAKELKDLPNLVFAKYDMDKNQFAPGARVNTFPSVRLYPTGERRAQDKVYEGSRTTEELTAWVRDNLSPPSEVDPRRSGFDSDLVL